MNTSLVSAREVADYLVVHIETVYRWTRERRIPCIRASSKHVRYDLAKVREALEQGVAK